MDNKVFRSLVLLTYKGKVLLMNKTNGPTDTSKHPWTLIEGLVRDKELKEQSVIRQVEREMGIKIEKVNRVSESYYHANLTDDNVNSIERSDNQLLDFFTVRELDNLLLSVPTLQFIQKHQELI